MRREKLISAQNRAHCIAQHNTTLSMQNSISNSFTDPTPLPVLAGLLQEVKDVYIPQKPGGRDRDTRDHELGEHPSVGVQLPQGH